MKNSETNNTYLSFMIDDEYFAVNVSKVLEVLQKQKITRVPNVTNDIKGVVNFRGEIIPVFETRLRFGLPDRMETEKYVVIVMEISRDDNNSIIGAITDRVKDVISIDSKDIMAVPKMTSKLKQEFLSGIYKQNDNFIMILDVDKMFTEQEINTMESITEQAEAVSV